MTSSLEDYDQESGRGGRDGGECSRLMLFRFADRTFHIRNISRVESREVKEKKQHLLDGLTHYCMEQSVCRQQVIAKYFSEDVCWPCNCCDVCQKGVTHEVKDYSEEARNVVECVTSMAAIQSKVKVNQLVMTCMGSKVKEVLSNGLQNVPQYGKGKKSFRNTSIATKFVQHLIFKGFLLENLQNLENRASLTFLSYGNITSLLNSTCSVYF